MKKTELLLAVIFSLACTLTSFAGWEYAINLGEVVNSDSADANPSISFDGGKLFFHSNREGGYGNKDIWVSVWDGLDWGVPVNLGSEVNLASEELSPSIDQSGDTLYFSSDRPGGEGAHDIWMTVLENGNWATPVNLGSAINSSYSERAPGIWTRGGKLYFHSDRPGGYGDMDIWCSERVGGVWQSPFNLGPNVNSYADDKNASVTEFGTMLYFTSNRSGGLGGNDLWASMYSGTDWGEAYNLGWRFNSFSSDGGPSPSYPVDVLYFNSDYQSPGESDLWMTRKEVTLVYEKWLARYTSEGHSDYGYAIAVDVEGNVYVAGSSDADYVTLKYDPLGNEVWSARYNGPDNSYDGARAITVDEDGNVYVTGYSRGIYTYSDYATIKYDYDGHELWVARYNGPGNYSDHAIAISLDGNGNVCVAGNSDGESSGNDLATVKYDPEGNELWVARYQGVGGDVANDMAMDESGNIYVTGSSLHNPTNDYYMNNSDYITVKYNQNGSELWALKYDGDAGSHDHAYAIAVDRSGNVFVTGDSYGDGTYEDYATIMYDSLGNEVWVSRYNSPLQDEANDIAIDGDGNVIVTGQSGSYAREDYATVKYDQQGNELWVTRFDGPNGRSDVAYAMTIDGEGNSYVTGRSAFRNDNCATIMYSPDGEECWVAWHNGPGDNHDRFNAITVDQYGQVYVTGQDIWSGWDRDIITIKYRQQPPGNKVIIEW